MNQKVFGDRRNIIFSVGFILFLLAAFLIRLYQLNSGLWLDEILTLTHYARLPYWEIISKFESENQHFLYSLLAHASIVAFGESAWSLRLPAVVFGVGSLWAVYWLGKEVTTKKEALLASILLGFSYHHLWFSQNARGYTGLLFWTLVSSGFLIRSLRASSLRYWIFYAITAALGAYTHLTMGFVIIGQLIVGFLSTFSKRRQGKQTNWSPLAWGTILTGSIILLLHLPVIDQMFSVIGGSEVSVVSEWKSPIWTIMEIIKGLQVGFSIGAAAFIFLAVAIIGMVSYWRTSPELIGIAIIPPAIGTLVTLGIGHHLWPRFYFFAFGFIVLIITRGLMNAGVWIIRSTKYSRITPESLGIALCCMVILLSAISMPLAYGPKQDFEAALQYLEVNSQPDDQVVVVGLAAFPIREYYQKDWTEIEKVQDLENITTGNQHTWLIYTFPEVLASINPDVMNYIKSNFVLEKQFNGTVNSGTIYLMKSK